MWPLAPARLREAWWGAIAAVTPTAAAAATAATWAAEAAVAAPAPSHEKTCEGRLVNDAHRASGRRPE